MKDRFNLRRERTLGGQKVATLPVSEERFWELVYRLCGVTGRVSPIAQVQVLVSTPPLIEPQHVDGGLDLWVIERSVKNGQPYRTATRAEPFDGAAEVALVIGGKRVTSRYLMLQHVSFSEILTSGGWAWSVCLKLARGYDPKKTAGKIPPEHTPLLDPDISDIEEANDADE